MPGPKPLLGASLGPLAGCEVRGVWQVQAVHLPSIWTPGFSFARQLRSGFPAAPVAFRLWLLPSGPDQVRGATPRRTRSSTPPGENSPQDTSPPAGIQPRYSGLRVQGTASSPSSTAEGYRTRTRVRRSIRVRCAITAWLRLTRCELRRVDRALSLAARRSRGRFQQFRLRANGARYSSSSTL